MKQVAHLLLASIIFFGFCSAAHASTTTLFSDSFAGTTIDTSKWIESDPAIGGNGGTVGNIQQSNGLTMVGNNNWNTTVLKSLDTFDRSVGNLILDLDVKSSNCALTQTPIGVGYGNPDISANPGEDYILANNTDGLRLFHFYNAGLDIRVTSPTFACSNNTPFHVKMVFFQTGGASLYLNGSTSPSATVPSSSLGSPGFTNQPIFLQTNSASSTVTYSNLVLTRDSSGMALAPTGLTAAPGDGQVGLSWNASNPNGFDVTDYVVEYRKGADAYAAFPDGTSTSLSTVVTGLTNGTLYSFRVSAVNANGTGSSTAVVTAIPSAPGATVPFIHQILSTGQSLSIGLNGAPALSTTQPYGNRMLSGAGLVPLVESGVETMSSALANSITAAVPGNGYDIAVTRHGVSATAYSGLKKGTTPYANGLSQATTTKAAATALGKAHDVIAVTAIHGESDHVASTSQAAYEADLVEWQRDYESDAKAITGQSRAIPFFTDQMSSNTFYNSATSAIPLAQLSASRNNPQKIYLVGPKYFLAYSDGVHLTNASYRWLGEYYAKAIKKVVIDGQAWVPLRPRQVVRSGNTIYARFDVPVKPLRFDTTIVSARASYGFEYSDASSSASISSVSLLGDDTVKIVLSGVPTGANQRLSYAFTGTPGVNAGAQVNGSIGGNLRDSDTASSLYGNTLYNWSVQFNEALVIDSAAPAITEIYADAVSGSTATITWSTDEASDSQVEYGLNSSYSDATPVDSATTTAHTVTLSGLTPGATYHFRVISKDSVENVATSPDQAFTTPGLHRTGTSSARKEANLNAAGASTQVAAQPAAPLAAPSLRSFIETLISIGIIPADKAEAARSAIASVAPSAQFNRDLQFHDRGEDVRSLQIFLNARGFALAETGPGSAGNETALFGAATLAALKRYQASAGVPPTGYFGPLTRASAF